MGVAVLRFAKPKVNESENLIIQDSVESLEHGTVFEIYLPRYLDKFRSKLTKRSNSTATTDVNEALGRILPSPPTTLYPNREGIYPHK